MYNMRLYEYDRLGKDRVRTVLNAGVDCFVYSFLDVVLHYFPSLAGPMYCKLLVPSIRIIF